MPDPWEYTVADRVFAGAAGVLLGFLADILLVSDSAVVWVAVPMAVGIAGAAFGWRALEAVIRLMWWLV